MGKGGKSKMLLQMKPSDLGELYALLDMYQNIYGPAGDNLLAEIAGNYKISAACYCRGRGKNPDIIPITNPRGAGRKRRDIPEESEKICQLRKSGMTIRAIASETGCSVGYVHKLIHEHAD